jgi:hypothetical protein
LSGYAREPSGLKISRGAITKTSDPEEMKEMRRRSIEGGIGVRVLKLKIKKNCWKKIGK